MTLLKEKLGFDDAFNYKEETDLKSTLKRLVSRLVILNSHTCKCGIVQIKLSINSCWDSLIQIVPFVHVLGQCERMKFVTSIFLDSDNKTHLSIHLNWN